MFERMLKIISDDDLEKIKKTKILLVGVGGVGGFALEALVRSGFGNITVIDGDIIEVSNLNRQIIALNNNLKESKVEEAIKRVKSINETVNIKGINVFLTEDNFKQYVNDDYDYIIDACDDLKVKLELVKYSVKNNIKIITCLGTGRKIKPELLKITSLDKTFNDPLAKKLRTLFRREQLSLKIPVIFSTEEAIKTEGMVGSLIFVPACAGIMLANYVLRDILNIDK